MVMNNSILPLQSSVEMFNTYRGVSFPAADESGIPELASNYSISAVFEIGSEHLDDSELINTSMRALSLSAISRQNDDDELHKEALQAYGVALRYVNEKLMHPTQWKEDSVLAAIRLLRAYESESGSATSWERHTMGTEPLLIMRGPAMHQTGLGHTLFLDARLHVTIVHLLQRTKTPLSDPDWMEIPFLEHPRDLRQRLLDVMLKFPTRMQDLVYLTTTARETGEDIPEKRLAFFDECFQHHINLEIWIDEFKTALGDELYDEVKDGIPVHTELNHFSMAYTLGLYWTARLILHTIILMAFMEIPVEDALIASASMATWCVSEPFAIKIAHSVDFFFRPDAGTLPPSLFAFPMGTAMNYFAYGSKSSHVEYVKFLQAFLSGKAGQTVGEFLRDLHDSKGPYYHTKMFEDPDDPPRTWT